MSITIETKYEFHKLASMIEEAKANQFTGRLACQQGDKLAYIYMDTGNITHATSDTAIGEEALYILLGWNDGTIEFQPKSSEPDYDTSCSIDHQQGLLFRETLQLFQPAPSSIVITPPKVETMEYSEKQNPIHTQVPVTNNNLSKDETHQNNGATAHNFGNTVFPGLGLSVSLAQESPTLELLQLGNKSQGTEISRQKTNLLPFIQQAIADHFTGFFLTSIKIENRAEKSLLVLEEGIITLARYSAPGSILTGQAAFDASIMFANLSNWTLTTATSNTKELKGYRAILSNIIAQSNLQATSETIMKLAQESIQHKSSIILKLHTHSRTLYYLIIEGEALGCYEVLNNTLEKTEVLFVQMLTEADVKLDMLSVPDLEKISMASLQPIQALGASMNGNAKKPEMALPGLMVASPKSAKAEPTVGSAANKESAEELPVDWWSVKEKGRRPYSNLAASQPNFNGLRRAFEKDAYTGIIEVKGIGQELYYLIEQGVPLGLFKFDQQTKKYIPSNFTILHALAKPENHLNVYLEQKRVAPQQYYELYLEALEAGSFNQAVQVVQQALRDGVVHETIYDAVFTRAMRQVGVLWEKGKMTVAQEHLATGITEYCRNLVLSSKAGVPKKRIGRALLTSVSGNTHTLGLNLLGDALRWAGWEVYPLNSELPELEIVDAAKRHQIDMVCLSVSLPGQIFRAIKAIRALRQSGWIGIIEVGGAAIYNNPNALQSIGADILGSDVESTVEQTTRLMEHRLANKQN
ncbi:MAG: cobalamin B12-binding domain-containing protein [Chloroflexi bacterium]|uniref:Cobalamin B12-binding domain-containing protein n=1 Tax=Candidatus Chlorohelix allophototropha TaxID=3003348 RepID=A0A8T7LU37_9CHLR|nr:cobalamin B12-binding domain-containing protein [Chloroflexota bacterium]WJW67407.1 cobalamin-dependent protein [Chloroflexota bacterium L227-S17]